MLKLTLPDTDNLYSELVEHPKVLRVVALSGGYSRDEACERLARNNGVIASFSRALTEGLTAQQSDEEFNATLDAAIAEHRQGVEHLSSVRGLAAALFAGALPALAFPAPSWWWLAWVGLVPLLLVVRAAPTASGGGDAGVVRHGRLRAGHPVLAGRERGPAGGGARRRTRRAVAAVGLGRASAARRPADGQALLTAVVVVPSAWVIAEAVRSWERLGGPWALLGASQWNQPATLASASLGGVWLTSFLIVAVNTAVVGRRPAAVRPADRGRGRHWHWRRSVPRGSGSGPRLRRVRRPGSPSCSRETSTMRRPGRPRAKHSRRHSWASASIWWCGVRAALASIWPAVRRRWPGSRGCPGGSAPTFWSTSTRGRRAGGIYKSSVLIGPDGSRGSYAKTRLVPFGEYVPLRTLFGWATEHTRAAAEDRRRGDGQVVLNTGSLAVGPLISFEATFSDLARREISLGAELLAYQSSTSTYQGSWAQPQLASMAAVHAVEVGHPAVHAGLSGVSAAFDARGKNSAGFPRVTRRAGTDVPLGSHADPLQRFGDWVIVLAPLIFTAWCAQSARRSWTGARRSRAPSRAAGPRWCSGRRCRRPEGRR